MNLHDLRIFEAVAATGSFTKAAQITNTVQSNVTARIKSLEDELRATLFNRTSRAVKLSSAGEILMSYSKQILHLEVLAKQEVAKAPQLGGLLKIGCIETTLALKVPGLITKFRKDFPDVELEFQVGTSKTLIADVLNYRLDAAFVSAPVDSHELKQVKVKDDQLVIIGHAKCSTLNSLLSNKPVTIVAFEQGCSFRTRLETLLNNRGITSYKCVTLNSIEGIVNFVEEGIGFSLLPEALIADFFSKRKLKIFSIPKQLSLLSTVMVYRNYLHSSKSLKAFINLYDRQ